MNPDSQELIMTKGDLMQLAAAVAEKTTLQLFPYLNQSNVIKHITKTQAKEILGVGFRALASWSVNGKRMHDGQYYTLVPDESGRYLYTDVLHFKKLLTNAI